MATIPRPAAGGIISTNVWGIPVTDHINALDNMVRTYPTEAALLADTGAPHGCKAIALDTMTRWLKWNPSWHRDWPRLVGAVGVAPNTAAGGTAVDIAGAAVAVPYYASHRYYIIVQACILQTVAAGITYLSITDQANNQIAGPAQSIQTNEYWTLTTIGFSTPGTAVTFKARLATTSGTATTQGAVTFAVVDYGVAGA